MKVVTSSVFLTLTENVHLKTLVEIAQVLFFIDALFSQGRFVGSFGSSRDTKTLVRNQTSINNNKATRISGLSTVNITLQIEVS